MTPTIELSEKQKKNVYAENGPIYVKASAGSGKTRVLTERVRHLLTQTNKKILALTFTNKAGEEIKERLSNISEIEKRVFVGTFHGFSQTILENHGNLIGLAKMPHIFEDEIDRIELVGQAIKQTPSYAGKYIKQDEKKRKEFCSRVLKFISEVKRELIADNELGKHTDDEEIVLLYQNYQELLKAQNAIDFDDLLSLAYSLLVNYPETAALYRRSFFAICIDEAQDLNNAQYQLLLALANGEFNNIMMVGDPNQSIYHFNGSSPDYMDKKFVSDFTATVVELNENYRSSKAVLSSAKKIFHDVEYVAEIMKEGIFEIKELQDEEAESQWVVEKIKELIALKKHKDIEGEITYEKIAVLARNKYIFKELETQLEVNALPYCKMTSGVVQFESDLMKIFDLALRVRLNPQDSLHGQRLSQIPNGFNKQKISSLVSNLSDDGSNLIRELEKLKKDNQIVEIGDENEKNMIFNDIDEVTIQHIFCKK